MKKLLPLLAALVALTACTQSIPGTPTAAGQNAAESGVTPPSGEKVKRQPIRLGLQNPPKDWKAAGAPFDPCTVLGWPDIPEAQRDPKNRPPKLMALKKDDAIETGCMFYNDEMVSIVIPSSGQPVPSAAPVTKSPFFRVSVVWGSTIDPARFGGEKVTIGGKSAAVVPDKIGSLNDPICLVAMKFGKGGGGVDVRNGRFPGLDPCPIAKALAEKLATKVP
ncbi:DUF3558 family protein [Crossiella cryophila]|uniref:DUF3558 domain-containing protein n=1 Tax=Crossiella cryophila TaxID=43355 RepID=A0A7W7CA39_9PSEU|nr:DUF3558 family protein [Crossiella cryophila]MBB4677280.1 hypothetical protein [Crossiella cryophila]